MFIINFKENKSVRDFSCDFYVYNWKKLEIFFYLELILRRVCDGIFMV